MMFGMMLGMLREEARVMTFWECPVVGETGERGWHG